MSMVEYGDPNYLNLRCPKCGNATEFVEFALRETKQPFKLGSGEPDWAEFEWIDEAPYPEEIVCGKCYGKELVTVWKAGPGQKQKR